ncbi:MAG: antitoxin Xre/MbcA/ParS toxin-binding domain-containing protein [Pseudomonadota bacterium]
MSSAATNDDKTILQLASMAFGADFAEDWFHRPTRIFGGLTPQQMAQREGGGQTVIEFIRALINGSQTDGELAIVN